MMFVGLIFLIGTANAAESFDYCQDVYNETYGCNEINECEWVSPILITNVLCPLVVRNSSKTYELSSCGVYADPEVNSSQVLLKVQPLIKVVEEQPVQNTYVIVESSNVTLYNSFNTPNVRRSLPETEEKVPLEIARSNVTAYGTSLNSFGDIHVYKEATVIIDCEGESITALTSPQAHLEIFDSTVIVKNCNNNSKVGLSGKVKISNSVIDASQSQPMDYLFTTWTPSVNGCVVSQNSVEILGTVTLKYPKGSVIKTLFTFPVDQETEFPLPVDFTVECENCSYANEPLTAPNGTVISKGVKNLVPELAPVPQPETDLSMFVYLGLITMALGSLTGYWVLYLVGFALIFVYIKRNYSKKVKPE